MRLKELRENLHLKQQDIADSLGCSTTVYCRYEKGTRQPSIDVLILLSSIFNVSVDYIIENDNFAPELQSTNRKDSFDSLIIQSFHQADAFNQVAICRLLGIDEQNKNLKKAT